ncbi:molybdenum cofactor guanylyltransferase [Methylomarinovum caldicuralii]|uniref:Molybdenum cofactor guanylyltransferase n=1 Tax=Methylomarinovum caldicuralii TaxID=438856 RepID=A0AAU9BRQ8_9GAMM|nr:molybdenum cofactor guanylyltransferase MobA [Methylomarinovum caldicuralii]BCX81513.1 molybdenum cofactor guanylyltransferase [Methylomarinovum caldicuralii]
MRREQLTGVVLAGGRARRLGGIDKGLLAYRGRPLIRYALQALEPLCGEILINANRNLADYRRFGHPVVPDALPDFQGPLAGILAAMQQAETPCLLVVPCDSPRLSATLLARLPAALDDGHDIAIAHDGQRLHPVVMALRTHLADDLAAWLAAGRHKIDRWAGRHRWTAVDCSDHPDAFLNVNTPEDLHGTR